MAYRIEAILMISSDLLGHSTTTSLFKRGFPCSRWQDNFIKWHSASRGSFATAELLVNFVGCMLVIGTAEAGVV